MMNDSPNERWFVPALEKVLPRAASSMPLQAVPQGLICEGLTLAVRIRYPHQSLALGRHSPLSHDLDEHTVCILY